jgi:AraC family transcriptional regulator
MVKQLAQGQYFGALLGRRELNGLVLTEREYSVECQVPTHRHENLYFCTLLRGGLKEIANGKERVCQPMTTLFHPAGEVHRDQFGPEGGHAFGLEFGGSWRERLRPYARWLERPTEYNHDGITWLLLRILREVRRFDDAAPLAIEGLSLEIISQMVRPEKPQPRGGRPAWLKRIEEMFEEHLNESFSLDQLSRTAGVHSVHLIRTFRRFHGVTVGEYLRRRRIEFACRQLQTSELTLAEIALRAGFYDQSHFTRTFKTMMGFTPSQYRSHFQAG